MIDGHYIMIPKEEYLEYETLKEKNTPKMIESRTSYSKRFNHSVEYYVCPICKKRLQKLTDKYCSECGQKLEEWI